MDSFFIIVIRYKTKNNAFLGRYFFVLGWNMGLEPTTFGTTIRRSNQLS